DVYKRQSQGITGNVSIFLSTNSGQTYAYTIATSTANNGSFSWKVPTTLGNPIIPILAKIMVVSVVDPSIYDNSDNVFTIQPLVGVEDGVLPTHFSISQNYPNPFNPSTVINYTVPNYSKVRIEVFDVLGRLVSVLLDEFQNQGKYSIKFEAGNLSSGTYIYRMTAKDFVEIRKMNLIK
ncbi:MAG: T9SS type A sorting domain-containing protein, partial [Ignavibacteria bacterium]|nr:T9SS type A sorting domain-containing protein [Ignavibacteria bacterium]